MTGVLWRSVAARLLLLQRLSVFWRARSEGPPVSPSKAAVRSYGKIILLVLKLGLGLGWRKQTFGVFFFNNQKPGFCIYL